MRWFERIYWLICFHIYSSDIMISACIINNIIVRENCKNVLVFFSFINNLLLSYIPSNKSSKIIDSFSCRVKDMILIYIQLLYIYIVTCQSANLLHAYHIPYINIFITCCGYPFFLF